MARKHVLTPLNKSNFTKKQLSERRAKEAALMSLQGLDIQPPEWLDKNGKAEYERIVPLLQSLPIASLDQTLVALYCRFYSLYLEASQDLEEYGVMDAEARKANPAFNILIKASSEIRLIASQLGMTIDSRMRMVTPEVVEEHDPFRALLEEN